ncbi:MAG: DUF4332 domain-containing protein [Chloroflexota bacterium]|nr:DUF4332 domain-containing protein [Chloroflexota bacterium]
MKNCTPATSEAGTEECYYPRWLGLATLLAGWVAWRVWQRTRRRPAPPPPASQPVEIPLTPSAPTDDLKRIEGIGPTVAALLETAGITTFAQLAVTEVTQLKSRLRAARLPFMDPTTWPQQAGLAAAGDWERLAVLQEELQGGRRA